jgi:hypothetical protein
VHKSVRSLYTANILLILTLPLAAQRLEPRLTVGRTTFVDDGLVHHLTVGGSLRAYLSRRWSFEPEFQYMRHDNFVRDRDYFLWGNFSFDILDRDRRVVPYLFAAPGLIHHRSSFGPQTFSSTEPAVGAGAGARIFLSPRIFIGPQVRFGFADGIFAEVTGSIGFILKK